MNGLSSGLGGDPVAWRPRDDLDRSQVVALIKKSNVREAGGEKRNFEVAPAQDTSTQRYVLCLARSVSAPEIRLHIQNMLVIFIVPILKLETTASGSFTLLADLISRPPCHQPIKVA